MPTPALDFLQKVDTWQRADGASAGLPVLMPDPERDTLTAILAAVNATGPSGLLEDRARRWLISYRELVAQQGGLTADQERELDSIVTCIPLWDHREHRAQSRRRLKPWQWITIGLASALIGLGAAGLVHALIGSSNGSPPPAGPVAAAPAGPQPGALTDLQRFRADWRVPASATADAGNPRQLVLLQDGLYYPAPWTVPAGDPAWQADTTSSIANIASHDAGFTLADVTDSDGITYTVAIGQPFVLASNPQVVFRISRGPIVEAQSMPQPHAIAVRTHI